MKNPKRILSLVAVPLLAVGFAATPWEDFEACTGNAVELDEAEVFIEFNHTDGDFGIQFFWDGEAWRQMKVVGPNCRPHLKVKVSSSLAKQGLTEGFFESAEPSLQQLSMKEFLKRFPEGEYRFRGRTLKCGKLTGEADFTHTIPAPPQNLCPKDDAMVDSTKPLVVSFDAVTKDLDDNPLEPELYEVILETENEILRVFSMVLEGDTANPQVTIPPEFLDPDTEYKYEVIVQEESGNRTISEVEFKTL